MAANLSCWQLQLCERVICQFVCELLTYRCSSTMLRLRVLVSVRRDDVSNTTVCCVVFIIMDFYSLIIHVFVTAHFGFIVCVCCAWCSLSLIISSAMFPQFFPRLLLPPHRQCISLISLSLLPVFPSFSSLSVPFSLFLMFFPLISLTCVSGPQSTCTLSPH